MGIRDPEIQQLFQPGVNAFQSETLTEMNAAMNTIEHRQVQRFPYFADHWRRTRGALEEMILRKAGKL